MNNREKSYKQDLRSFEGLRAMLCLVLAAVMTFAMMPGAALYAFGAEAALALEEGAFAPGEVIVMFRDGAVKDRDTSLRAARKIDNVGDEYGSAMDAAGEAGDAADDAKSEAAILRASLGDDFVLKDSLSFDDDLNIALVSSDKYDTETLIEKLSANHDIASAEPNWYTEGMSYNYSLNDTLNQYAYQANSPADKNAAGKDVSGRGTDPVKTLSVRAGSVTDFAADHSGEDEVVVAVIDSGINYNHEDLKNMLWTNPGNIGLKGEHGFNFEDNAEEIMDSIGHGTHIAGIIAAEANNARGIAGIASGVNVKIMMLANGSAKEKKAKGAEGAEKGVSTTYCNLGAMNYALKAREDGVNVAAINCSWGINGYSFAYDKILDRLGEAGIISFLASGNNADSTDVIRDSPSGTSSQYAVRVGSADVSGKPSSFSNYGKSNVDLFSMGSNILSSVPYSTYFPNLYSEEQRAENTEYYGQFSSETEIGAYDPELGMNRVVPDTAGTGVKPFGAAKFVADAGEDNGDEQGQEEGAGGAAAPQAACEVSVDTEKTFTDNYGPGYAGKPASLKVTIRNARMGEKYYVYFPYDKNHETTGPDNTAYSGSIITSYKPGDFNAQIDVGEVIRREKDGKQSVEIMDVGNVSSNELNEDTIRHCSSLPEDKNQDKKIILSWDEADPEKTDVRETGIGFMIQPSPLGEDATDQEHEEYDNSIRDISFCIDAIGVSKPVTGDQKLEDVFPAESSYDLMSGTSQATPSAAAAYAVLASLDPKSNGQSGADYAMEMKAKLFSCVRQTDELRGLCSTGGYVDLSLLKEDAGRPSVTDAVCDADEGTITLHGSGLTKDLEVFFRSLAAKDAVEKRVAEAGVKTDFAADGRSITLSNARSLMGTYTEFTLRNAQGEERASGSFFLVNGYKKFEKVLTEEHKGAFYGDEENLPARYIFTDTDGKTLYGYQMNSESGSAGAAGVLYRYDGTEFAEVHGTILRDAVFDYYENELGYDRHQITRGIEVKPWTVRQAIYENNVLYDFVDVTYMPYDDAPDEETVTRHYLASLSYTAAKPVWRFRETDSIENILTDIGGSEASGLAYCVLDGRIYMFGSPDADTNDAAEDRYTFVYSCDVKTGKWEKGTSLEGTALTGLYAYPAGGKIYLMFGREACDRVNNNRIYTYDRRSWKRLADIPFVGRTAGTDSNTAAAIAPVKDGLMFINYSVDGAGNVSLYNTSEDRFEPMYYTLNRGLSEPQQYEGSQSAVEMRDGIYFISLVEDPGGIPSLEMYLLPRESGAYDPSCDLPADPSDDTEPALSITSAKLDAGNTVSLKVTGGKIRSWTSSSKTVASVSKGKVIALTKGKAVIIAVLDNGTKLTCTVNVRTSPKLSKKTVTVRKGRTVKVKITGKAAGVDNAYRNTKKAKITSGKNASTIKVKGLKKGTTTVKVRVNGKWLSLKVKVK